MCSSAFLSQSLGVCFDAEKLVCRLACCSAKRGRPFCCYVSLDGRRDRLQKMGLALGVSRVLKMCCSFDEH